VLPKPCFANSFCMFPIHEGWHLGKPSDRENLRKVVEDMRAILGPERLYAHLGVAVISEGAENEAYALARELGIGLVLQGGAIEHHAHAWGFNQLLNDPQKGDRRLAQWFQDGRIADPGQEQAFEFGVRVCSSRYAKAAYELRRQVETARAARLAKAFRDFPETVVGCSGPIECEMHQGDNRWGDYSPYTIAEFRDYLTHRGIYAKGAERAGLGYPGGERFAEDPSPAKAKGDRPSFNAVFGTSFTTWSVRYWDPERFPNRVPLDAPGMPRPGEDGYIAGGFDAPRVWPGEKPAEGVASEGNQLFWDAWASVDDASPGFRVKLLNFWVRDHTRWLVEAGVPKQSIFSHQIPGESYGFGRLSRGASAVWTADTPTGNIGITTYFGAASDVGVFQKIVARNPNWGIFEYHPHPINALEAPVSEYLHSLQTCIRFRAHILTPISWTDEGKDFIVRTGAFPAAIKQVMASLPDQPYYNRTYIDYAPPPVSAVKLETAAGKTQVSWSPLIWPDRRFTWADWREFDRFEVRDISGKVLASTKDCQAEVPGKPDKLAVVAVKRSLKPKLPQVAGLSGSKGRLVWGETFDFFCDHYRVEAFGSPQAKEPLLAGVTKQARFEIRPPGDLKEVFCRVAAADASGALGPFSPLTRISLPRPGRRIADLSSLKLRVENSPDTAWRDEQAGGVTEPSLFEHPPLQGGGWARAEFTLKLPAVAAGQRILFAAESGIKDGAKQSDGVIFRVEVNGESRHEELIQPETGWHPLEVDLTAQAGQEIALALMTNPNVNSVSDWACWGDPQVLLVGKGVTERPAVAGIVANGKEVRGKVTLRWQDKATDGSLWSKAQGFAGFRVYRGADRDFAADTSARLGETRQPEFVDATFDGRETYYRVTAVFDDGTETPPSQAIQYAP